MEPRATTPAAYTASATHLLWRWITAAAIFCTILLSYWANAFPFNGQDNGAVSAKYPTLLTPAGYAFSIWGLIFLSLAIYAVWQLLPAQRTSQLPDAVAQPLTLACLATGGWLVVFAYELMPLSGLVMLLILGALIVVFGRVRRRVRAGLAPRWVSVPFALYLGWISVASVINITIGLRTLGWQPAANGAVLLTFVLLSVITALALVIGAVFRSAVFALVVAWALVGIWVAQRGGPYPELVTAALVGAGVAALGGVALSLRPHRERVL